MKKKKMRIVKAPEVLAEKVIDYFFKNPNANSMKEMEKKYDVAFSRIYKIISDELKRRREISIAKNRAK